MRPHRAADDLLLPLLWSALLVAPAPRARAVPLHPAAVHAAPAGTFDRTSALAAGLDRPAERRSRLPDRAVVLLVDFDDEPGAGNITVEAVDAAFFGAEGSVRDFYMRSSYGRFVLAGTVGPWVRLPRTLAFYADGRAGVGGSDQRNARRMVADAVRAADPFVDFALFDNDGPDGMPSSGDDDGQVDALVVVHAGRGAEYGDPNDILSHSWFTPGPVCTDDGPFVWGYATVSETSPLGVRAHEYGHLLGLPDLYDRSATSFRAPGGLGDWSLMASGAWLDDGDRPTDLDGPSKIELGFVDPIVPVSNATGLTLGVGRQGDPPDIYQVWTHGLIGSEYLVLENRRPEGLDAMLPGGGMLVYHVNLLQATNDDPDDLRVQLLQGDGLEEIEGFHDSGDADDPFPSIGGDCCRLDATTTPGTRARDDSDTQIVISNISTPTATMTFDVQVESRPFLRIAGHALRELRGDADGVPEAGEELELEVTLENLGMATGDLVLQWSADPVENATWSSDSATLDPLGKLQTATARFVLQARGGLGDPFALVLRGAAVEAGGRVHAFELAAGLGEHFGFQACFDAEPSSVTRDCADPELPWRIDVLRGDAGWSLEPRPGDLGLVYRSARGARYPNGADVALVSPPFNLQPGSELHLLHAYDIEDLGAGWAHDGGRVEISMHGGAWGVLVPRDGYPRRLFPESVPVLAAQEVFAGRSARRWDRFDLASRTGSARLRFRFVSNDSIGASGWEIARVEVRQPDPALETQRGLTLIAEPNPVRFPTRVAFRVRSPRSQSALRTRLRLFDARGRLVRVLDHEPVPAQSGRFIWDGTDHAGHPVPSGIYLARLEWGSQAAATKLLVLR